MYQPKINDENIRKLYIIAKSKGIPMTKLINKVIKDFKSKN